MKAPKMNSPDETAGEAAIRCTSEWPRKGTRIGALAWCEARGAEALLAAAYERSGSVVLFDVVQANGAQPRLAHPIKEIEMPGTGCLLYTSPSPRDS